MTMMPTISAVLTAFLLVVHSGLTVIDFFGLAPMADFIVREDGSQMQPQNMLPLEDLFVAMLSFPFFIVVIGFVLLKRLDAAKMSVAIHGIFALHQIWKKPVWDAIMHPKSEMISTNFFIYSHAGWAIVSAIIVFISDDVAVKGNNNNNNKDNMKES